MRLALLWINDISNRFTTKVRCIMTFMVKSYNIFGYWNTHNFVVKHVDRRVVRGDNGTHQSVDQGQRAMSEGTNSLIFFKLYLSTSTDC